MSLQPIPQYEAQLQFRFLEDVTSSSVTQIKVDVLPTETVGYCSVFDLSGNFVTKFKWNGIDTVQKRLTGIVWALPSTGATDTPGTFVPVYQNYTGFYIPENLLLNKIIRFLNGQESFNVSNLRSQLDATSGDQYVRLSQVVALVSGGSISLEQLVVTGTQALAGEALASGVAVYFNEATQRWLRTTAGTPSTVTNVILGITNGSGTINNPVTNGITIYGTLNNLTGLTPGAKYYLSDTLGQISTTFGTTKVFIGVAATSNRFIFNPAYVTLPTFDEKSALAGTFGTPSATNKYVTDTDPRLSSAFPVSHITTGADGALNVTSGTTFIDCGGQNYVIKNYTSINISTGATLSFNNLPATGGCIVELRCTSFTNAGTVNGSALTVNNGYQSTNIDSLFYATSIERVRNGAKIIMVGSQGINFPGSAGQQGSSSIGGAGGTGGGHSIGLTFLTTPTGANGTNGIGGQGGVGQWQNGQPGGLSGGGNGGNAAGGWFAGGGGGGSGANGGKGQNSPTQQNNAGAMGANGKGGISIFLTCTGAFNNTGTINLSGENGGNGGNAIPVTSQFGHGGGGGGNGGTGGNGGWLLASVGSIVSTGTINVSGGNGGNGGNGGDGESHSLTNCGGGGGGAAGKGGLGGRSGLFLIFVNSNVTL
jgi:hypothetical protein